MTPFRWLVVSAFAVTAVACQCSKPPPATPTLKDEREACAKDEECKTGLCEGRAGDQTVCTRKCADGCQTGEICSQLTQGRFSCVQDRGGLCQACTLDSDCPYPSDKCIVIDGKGVCGRDCAFDQKCPTSYKCLNGLGNDGKAKPQQCSPASGSCTCTAASAGQMISCMTTSPFGTCTGKQVCDGVSGFSVCDAKTAVVETCNGIDDNCNGTIDEGMQNTTCGLGACQRTVSSCTDGGVVQCVPGAPMTEVCNGIDDDCDGVIDNPGNLNTDINNCGHCGTVCALDHATPKCMSGACQILTCNTGFDNCNGIQPDGCETNLKTDVNNCNGCNMRCSAPGADAQCDMGSCTYTCKTGFYNLDNDWSNGCEYACTFTSAIDLPDVSFVDANCDGIDGELNNGVFVSASGDDLNPGTLTQPVATIAQGVTLAHGSSKRDVYVTLGTYNGPVTLDANAANINIAGGYSPASATRWSRSNLNTTLVLGGNPALSMTNSNNTRVQFISFRGDNAVGVDSSKRGNSAYGAKISTSSGVKLELVTIQAGNGANGGNGDPGTSFTTNGGNGGDGQAGSVDDNTFLICLGHTPARTPGSGGTSSCGKTGGAGGTSGSSYNQNGVAGSLGVINVSGGPAGGPEVPIIFNSGVAVPNAALRGTNGPSGTPGTHGMRSVQVGSLVAGGYLPPIGGNGTNGTDGYGGGGGGGGGGGCQYLGGFICQCYTRGSAGGGGGGGGCGGTGGTAAGSGGGSFALMLWQSQVLTTGSTLKPGRGGDGGNGGAGGTGSNGGNGGTSLYSQSEQETGSIGGPGGNGGNGGAGGHGAGGSGGAAIGLVRDSAASTINSSQINFRSGTAGNAGNGGGGSGSANDGLPGLATDERAF